MLHGIDQRDDLLTSNANEMFNSVLERIAYSEHIQFDKL